MNAARGPTERATDRSVRTARTRPVLLLLLLIPFVGTLWVSSYARLAPAVWGIPFFYWYQFLWIGISTVITVIVYLVERREERREERQADQRSSGA